MWLDSMRIGFPGLIAEMHLSMLVYPAVDLCVNSQLRAQQQGKKQASTENIPHLTVIVANGPTLTAAAHRKDGARPDEPQPGFRNRLQR